MQRARRRDPLLPRVPARENDLGKAATALLAGVLCFCWPPLVAYPAGGFLYLAIHRFRPVAAWLYRDLRMHLSEGAAADDRGGLRPSAARRLSVSFTSCRWWLGNRR